MWFMDYPTKDTVLTALLMASPRWCWKGFVVLCFFFFFAYSHTKQKLKKKNFKCSTEEHQLLTYIKYKPKIIITDIYIITTDMITDLYKILTHLVCKCTSKTLNYVWCSLFLIFNERSLALVCPKNCLLTECWVDLHHSLIFVANIIIINLNHHSNPNYNYHFKNKTYTERQFW
jgi:hypothetical protein